MIAFLQAQDSEERERWIRSLEDAVLRHNQQRAPGAIGATFPARAGTRRSYHASNGSGAPATIEDFDKKLGETDSYLELLLSQVIDRK